jgi:Tol biopolymer transport system component
VPVTHGTRLASSPQPSPDGEWVTFQEANNDIFVVRSDGSGLRQLTDDAYNDRQPFWSSDGKLLAFHSNRGGKVDIWTIRPDGGGLHQLTYTPGGSVTRPVWSPDGKKLVYSLQNGTPFVIEPDKPWSSQSPQALPPLSEPDTWFEVNRYSPDGSKLSGFRFRDDGIIAGISIYSFKTGKYTRITDFGMDATWLKDGRRLIFARNIPADGEIRLVDSESQKIHTVLSVAPNLVTGPAISADNRWIYFCLEVTEADIWLANLQ